MPNVLEKIVADKRQELTARKAALPLEKVKANLTPSVKSLFEALRAPNAGFILECKKASPSKGLIRDVFNLDEILAAYTPYAAGISVLTDEKYFQGSYDYLRYVTDRVSQPVLNKDFFVDEYQVYLARYHKADAILLMLSVLNDDEYRQLAGVANALGLDILTEVSNAEEMHRAIGLEAKIIGINNRDLRDLSTDLATTEKLVPLLKDARHEPVVISESGIYTHQDVLRLAPLCQGFLVGSALMAQADLPKAVRQLTLGTVKVCGLTRPDDARIAFGYGASYGGLIFTPKSKRCISVDDAQALTRQIPGDYVGVFVDQSLEEVVNTATQLKLSAVQLHGHETPDYRALLRLQLPQSCQIWQACGISDHIPESLPDLLGEAAVDKVLLDCKVGSQSGGTGQQFDWRLIDNLGAKDKLALAGGIGPDSVQAALRTGVAMVDVNSGVETAPGLKSATLLNELFQRCRQY